MTGSFYTITVVGAHRRVDLRLPADVPVGELTGELAVLLEQPADGAPPRWGLARLGGEVLDAERGLAAQDVPAGAMLFLRDLGVAEPQTAIDDYATAVAAVVEAHPGRWTSEAFLGVLTVAAVGGVLAAGALAGRDLLAGTVSDQPGVMATGVAAAALVVGRGLRSPRAGVALALAALPLWAVAGAGLYLQLGLRDLAAVAGALVGLSVGGLAAVAAADEGMVPTVGLTTAAVPWALTLAACAFLQIGPATGAAVLVPVEVTVLRLLPWTTIRLVGLGGEPEPATIGARVRTARQVLTALTAGTAVALAGACAVLAVQATWWARSLAIVAAVAAVLHARRRRFSGEVVPLLLVGLTALAAFELAGGLLRPELPALLVCTAGALVAIGLVGRAVRLPVGLRRQLERLEALAATTTGPLALGLLGLYDAAARFAGRFG